MKILFIFPPKKFWALKEIRLHKKIDEEAGNYPPLGILYVAAYLLKHTSHKVEVIDAPSENLDYPLIEQEIKKRKPDLVGIYFCTEYLYDSIAVAKLVKGIDKNIITVAGGPHLYIYPRQTISIPEIDYCIYGEGEVVFKDLVEALDRNISVEDISGVISKSKLETQLQKISDLDSLPFPARRLTKISHYKSFITYSNPITTMMTSRGCAYNCYYCNSIERAQKVRFHSPEYVVKEIEEIVNLGIKDILFFDENFTFDIDRVREICEEIINKKIKVRWHCRSRADMKLNREILKKMKSAGCRMIQFGIETGTPRLQQVINKKLDLDKVRQTVKLVQEHGILVYGNFINGFPTETKEEMLKTIQFAIDLDLDYAPFGVFNPLPESVFYIEGLKNGTIKKDYWLEYVHNPTIPVTDYWWPLHDKEMLTEINRYAFRRFYFRPRYILKAIFRNQTLLQKFWQVRSAIKIFGF